MARDTVKQISNTPPSAPNQSSPHDVLARRRKRKKSDEENERRESGTGRQDRVTLQGKTAAHGKDGDRESSDTEIALPKVPKIDIRI